MKTAPIFWCTGLSGAGKTTVTSAVKERLGDEGLSVTVFDGDDVRSTQHRDLGFTEVDIKLNNALIVELCHSSREDCDVILVPIISPYRESRRAARMTLEPGFYEVWFDASLAIVEARDTKGLYAKARIGEIDNLIGVSASNPYEMPEAPDFTVSTANTTVDSCTKLLHGFILEILAQQ